MFKNNILIALRNLRKNILYTVINLLGLAFGMLCFILLSLYAIDEWSFDRFHQNADRIYRVVEQRNDPDKGSENLAAVAMKVSGGSLAAFPEIESACMITEFGRMSYQNKENERSFYEPFTAADNEFLHVFDFKMLHGDPATALDQPNSVVLTHEFAERLFGNKNPLGKSIDTDRGKRLEVTGVLEILPLNSHLQFPALISASTFKSEPWYERFSTSDWTSNFFSTYFKLKPGTEPQKLADKITGLVKANYPKDQEFRSRYSLQSLSDIHFHSAGFQNDMQANAGNEKQSYMLAFIGLFILLIACINYMNLATARSEVYGREVGIRKVVGASRHNLFNRFFLESLVLTVGAFGLAAGLGALLLPAFNAFTEKNLTIDPATHAWIMPFFGGLILLVGLVAGAYPSLLLSRHAPIKALRGVVSLSGKQEISAGRLRRGLVVFQFVLGMVMIIATLVAFQQMDFIRKKDLGFNQQHLVVADINSGNVRRGFAQIKAGYAQLPNVQSVTVSNRVPGEWKVIPKIQVQASEKEKGMDMYYFSGDDEFLNTFEIALTNGRNFDRKRAADTAAVLINRQAATLLGIQEAGEQIVQIPSVSFDGTSENLEQPFTGKVIGIIENFHFQSLHEKIQPVVVGHFMNPIHSIDYFTARISGNDVSGTLAAMEKILHETDPGHLFEYHFLDQQIDRFYENETRQSKIFSAAAACAIFIACLGLFDQAVLSTRRRTKEIGIRKVLGASVSGLIGLLSREFLSLVFIAFFIAVPLAWYAMDHWLADFAYHISISWWVFGLAGLAAVTVAFFTVSTQCIKAAMTNPVNSLRNE